MTRNQPTSDFGISAFSGPPWYLGAAQEHSWICTAVSAYNVQFHQFAATPFDFLCRMGFAYSVLIFARACSYGVSCKVMPFGGDTLGGNAYSEAIFFLV